MEKVEGISRSSVFRVASALARRVVFRDSPETCIMGRNTGAWAGLPLEAGTVWTAVIDGRTIVREAIKIRLYSGKSAQVPFGQAVDVIG